MKNPNFEEYIMIGLALISGAVAFGILSNKVNGDEINITDLQGQYSTISSNLSALAIGQATIQQKVNDIDNHVK